MYRNRLRRRWEATQPIHLVGWSIISQKDAKEKRRGFVKMNLVNNITREQRECWVHEDIVPMEVVQRNYE